MSEIVGVTVHWTREDGRGLDWRGFLPGSFDVDATVRPPPVPEDLAVFRFDDGGSGVQVGLLFYATDAVSDHTEITRLWQGPLPVTFRTHSIGSNFTMF